MVIRKTCLYKYKMNKVKHYILPSHKLASISLFKLLQFNVIGQIQRLAVVLLVFFSFYQSIYFPYIYIYVTYMLDLILHICYIYI